MDEKIINDILKNWDTLLGKKNNERPKKIQNRKELIKILRRRLNTLLNTIITSLKIELDRELINKIKNTINPKEKTRHQKELIKSLLMQFKRFPLEGEIFLPADIQKFKKFNCAGGSLLFTQLLNKAKIKNYYGVLFKHVVNIVRLTDDSFIYVCTRANLKGTTGHQREKQLKGNMVIINSKIITDKETGIKYLKILNNEIPYKIIILLPENNCIFSIIDNMENKFFAKVKNLLFPEVYRFQKDNELWQQEERYFNSPKGKRILIDKYVINC